MPFTIPNSADAAFPAQAAPDKVDIDILQAGIRGDGVVTGCAVTAQGSPDMTLAVAAGTVRIAAVDAAVTAGNVTITTANATNPRIDLVVVNSSGTKSVTAGTAAASPVCPAIPATSVVLAMVYVPANDTAINTNQITDKRVDLATMMALSGTLAQIPAAAASNKGMLYLATDVATGTLYRSDGSSWTQAAAGLNLNLTAKGDIQTFATSANRLGVGTAGQILMPRSTATNGIEWIDNPNTGSLPLFGAVGESAPRAQAASATVAAAATGVLRMVAVWLPARAVVKGITFVVGSTAGSGITHSFVALYDGALALLRQSTDNPSQALTASTGFGVDLSSTFTITASGFYYVGLCVVATTMPTYVGFAGSGVLNALTTINSGTSTGSLTTTAPNPAAALTAVGGVPYVSVYT